MVSTMLISKGIRQESAGDACFSEAQESPGSMFCENNHQSMSVRETYLYELERLNPKGD